jgi:sec-independent protein translocase protein TatA
MFDRLFEGWTPIVILVVVVLLFGATRLPALARSLGQSRNAFRNEMKKGEEDAKAQSTEAKPADTSISAGDDTPNSQPKP